VNNNRRLLTISSHTTFVHQRRDVIQDGDALTSHMGH